MASTTQLLADEGHDGPNKGGRRSSGALAPHPQEEGLRCPRCDSPNTKFCYYNNYSLTQPRHYCKACRRYWTRGGALRNVPVGGGCRKNKKSKSSASSSSRFSLDSKDSFSFSSEPGAGFKFFHGFSPDSDLGTGLVPFSRLHSTSSFGLLNSNISKQLVPYEDLPAPTTVISSQAAGASTVPTYQTGINYSFGNYAESANNTNTHSRLASNIESLSSISQDLHWKLQQQRLAMFIGGESHQESTSTIASALPTTSLENQHQSISFQMPLNSEPLAFASGNSKSNISCVGDVNAVNEWYLGGSSSCNTSRNPGNTCTDLIKTWKDMHQFSALP